MARRDAAPKLLPLSGYSEHRRAGRWLDPAANGPIADIPDREDNATHREIAELPAIDFGLGWQRLGPVRF